MHTATQMECHKSESTGIFARDLTKCVIMFFIDSKTGKLLTEFEYPKSVD